MIHDLADVQTTNIGINTQIWQYAVVLKGAEIGDECNINCHTFIENDVRIGNRVTIKSGCFIWDGLQIEDDVFVGPNVTFTNDLRPRSKLRKVFPRTILRKGCSIGGNASILAGIEIGEYAMVGMGALVTKSIPDFALVYGNPARIKGWVDKRGISLEEIDNNVFRDQAGNIFSVENNRLIKRYL